MRETRFCLVAALATMVAGGCGLESGQRTDGPASETVPLPEPAEVRSIEIDLDTAEQLVLPVLERDLVPVAFRTTDGRDGWCLRIPGNRPIATPAFANGKLFVGGGYGSHEFYAFDAQTGEVAWQIRTSDDGPTAAVVEDGFVAFNTESCTVIVCRASDGKVVWEEWLGDPLMSQPAIHEGRVYVAHPAGQRRPTGNGETEAEDETVVGAGSHRLLCADLATGKHLWERALTGDVIAAPVIDGGRVYLTCFDGTSFCFEEQKGDEVWRKEGNATASPVVADGRILFTTRDEPVAMSGAFETLFDFDADGALEAGVTRVRTRATYLEAGRNSVIGIGGAAEADLEASVGFSTAPASAGLDEASSNTGISSVVAGWAYQGSRAAIARGMALNAQGATLNGVPFGARAGAGGGWRATVTGAGVRQNVQTFAPPSLGLTHMYLAAGTGHLAAVNQEDGEVAFLYATKHPMVFQPTLANGSMYVGTADGLLICLKTGTDDADDWSMWGGNAQHNKTR